jgi:lipase
MARNMAETYDLVRALDIPVLVVRARPMDPAIKPWDPLGSPTWPGLAAEFPQGRDLPFGDKTHFLPMEDPALMAQLIEAEIAALPQG